MLVLQNISKKFQNHEVLKDVTLQVRKGEFIVLTGVSGAGKSTLLKLLIGMDRPTAGYLLVDGQDITALSSESIQLMRRNLGVVFQDYNLLDTKTVYENVAFALEVCEKPADKIPRLVEEALETVGLLERQNAFPMELSGGEKQRAAIARAVVHKPAILIADEPTGNLDTNNIRAIIQLLRKINNTGTTVLLTTHNQEIIDYFENHQKRMMNLRDGVMYEHVGKLTEGIKG
jgi:cell division transport system ATP-binding protein